MIVPFSSKNIIPTAEHKENMIKEHLDEDNLYYRSLNSIIGTLLSNTTVYFPISYAENAGYLIYKNKMSYIEKLTKLTGDKAILTYIENYKLPKDLNRDFVEEFLMFHSDLIINKIIAKLDESTIQKIINAIVLHITGQFNIICRINGHRFLLRYSPMHRNLVELMGKNVSDYINILSIDNLKRSYDLDLDIKKGRNKYSLSTVIDKFLKITKLYIINCSNQS